MTRSATPPGPYARHWDWQLSAACRAAPTEAFFRPEGERGPDRQWREVRGKELCARCVVVAACRTYAVAAGEDYGIWGGLNEEELRAHRRTANAGDTSSAAAAGTSKPGRSRTSDAVHAADASR